MNETKYIFTEETKDVNDALNRLSVIIFMLHNEKPNLASQVEKDILTLQKFANKYGYFEICDEQAIKKLIKKGEINEI